MAKKIDVEKFKKWLTKQKCDEEHMVFESLAKGNYADAYGYKEAVNVYEFILNAIEAGDDFIDK